MFSPLTSCDSAINFVEKTKKYFPENTINSERMMNNCQQIMTVIIKNRTNPLATSLSGGARRKPRINCLSVVIWMQHLAVIYAKAEKHYEKTFSKCNSLQQFTLYGEKTAETNIWLASYNEMDIFIHTELSQRLRNERTASTKTLSGFLQ